MPGLLHSLKLKFQELPIVVYVGRIDARQTDIHPLPRFEVFIDITPNSMNPLP